MLEVSWTATKYFVSTFLWVWSDPNNSKHSMWEWKRYASACATKRQRVNFSSTFIMYKLGMTKKVGHMSWINQVFQFPCGKLYLNLQVNLEGFKKSQSILSIVIIFWVTQFVMLCWTQKFRHVVNDFTLKLEAMLF